MGDGEPLADIAFTGEVIEWRGPAPFYFVTIPDGYFAEIRYAAQQASYGWGVVPVSAAIGDVTFETSLFPRNGGYLLPLKIAVRKRVTVAPGDVVDVTLQIYAPSHPRSC